MIRRFRTSLVVLTSALAVGVAPSSTLSAQSEAAPSGPEGPAPAPAPSPWVPVPIVAGPGGPTLLRLPAAAPGTVALRLSVPIREEEIEAGWAQVIATLARSRLPGLLAPLGVEADVSRTPWGIVYSVAGPRTDFDYLAYVLRELAGAPDFARVEEARTLLRNDHTRREETGRGRVEMRLRTATTGSTPPLLGTGATIEALSAGGIRDLWARTHRPDRMTLLVSGDVSDPLVLSSFADVGTREPAPASPSGTRVPAGPTPDVLDLLRTSAGVAWTRPRPLAPEVAVAAILLTEQIRATDPGFEARVLVWETPGRSTLAVVGAAFADGLPELRRWITSGLSRVRSSLDPARVAEVAHAVRGEVLMDARTPLGQLRAVGRFVDAGLGPQGFASWLEALDGMTAETLDAALAEMIAGDPATVEIRR